VNLDALNRYVLVVIAPFAAFLYFVMVATGVSDLISRMPKPKGHLHDREWVYAPLGDGYFQRTEIVAGNMLPNNRQEIEPGIKPGDQVVSNSLDLQTTVEQ
jgi:hypothetical protein